METVEKKLETVEKKLDTLEKKLETVENKLETLGSKLNMVMELAHKIYRLIFLCCGFLFIAYMVAWKESLAIAIC